MDITLLTTINEDTRKNLTKRFSLGANGETIKSDYDRAYLFDADVVGVYDIHGLSALLTWLQDQPNTCIVRGQTTGATRSIRRALVDDPAKGPATLRANPAGVQWVMLDFDKLPVSSLNLTTEQSRLDYLVGLLPDEFQGVTYHYQWSSSAAMDGWATVSAHLWFWLDTLWLCRDLYERFDKGDFANCEVDPAPFTPNQIHYTANPIFAGIVDPVGSRSGIVRGFNDAVSLSTWYRPVEPAPAVRDRDHYQQFGLSRFEALLTEIGPDYHRPILRAAAHYCAVVPVADRDLRELEIKLREAISTAPAGRNRRADYLDGQYLERVISGASRKFGGAF